MQSQGSNGVHCESLVAVFRGLQTETTTEPVSDLVRYNAINWIDETMFPPKDWNTYGEAVRTTITCW